MYMPKYLISLTHGRMVPLDILMGLQEKLFFGPILKQQDFLTLIAISSGSSSCSQIFSNLSSIQTDGAINKISSTYRTINDHAAYLAVNLLFPPACVNLPPA